MSIKSGADWQCLSASLHVNLFYRIVSYRIVATYSLQVLVARQINNRKVVGSRPTEVMCITVLTGNRLG